MDSECWVFAGCELNYSPRVPMQNVDVQFLYLGFLGSLAFSWIDCWIQAE